MRALRIIIFSSTLMSAIFPASLANAGVYTDDLGKCLVSKTSAVEKTDMIRWFVASLSVNDAVRPMTKVTPADADMVDRKMAALLERLITVDCKPETTAAVRYEGTEAFQASFRVLGEVATRELMADPTVNRAMGNFVRYLHQDRFEAVMKDAGVPSPNGTSTKPPQAASSRTSPGS